MDYKTLLSTEQMFLLACILNLGLMIKKSKLRTLFLKFCTERFWWIFVLYLCILHSEGSIYGYIYARKVGSSNWWRVAVNPSTIFRRLHLPNDFNPLLFSGRKFVFHHLCLVFNWLEWSTVITNLTFDNIRVGKFTIQSSTLLMKSFLVKIHIYWTDYLAPSTLRSINQLWLYCRFHLPLQFHYKWIRL